MNAIELLKQQHEKVLDALDQVHSSGGSRAELTKIADEIVAHTVIEEHIFYPRVKAVMGEMFAESFEEHAVARFELARLLMATDAEVKSRALVLKELLEHHVEEEEEELFPKVQKAVGADELMVLGRRMETAFDAAVSKGFEACLAAPPPPIPRQVARRSAGMAMSAR
jgi:hemerythrin superfamily protein